MASPKTKKSVTKKPVTKKIAKSKKTAPSKPESTEPELAAKLEAKAPIIEDPIGNETDGEAEIAAEQAAEIQETASALYQGTTGRSGLQPRLPHAQRKNDRALAPEGSVVPEEGGGFNPRIKSAESKRALAPDSDAATEPDFTPQPGAPADGSSSVGWKPRPPAKLERLQKILAAAGVASRRSAEAMIEQGRVQVNGKVVTVLGTKADAARDHIRVDGKLLQGPERLRYFVLNKPRGFVTTVKDPEGRPTVMQFFDKMKERLYPVGRLDYMSEGLLVVTNDGELANRLTKASSGVEKTYLVKVAGQPTEAELNILRGGVAIERGKSGSPPVRTSPARIRQVRQGDNPWYEVVLIEGRNRELRKMFEEVGHFVEKIRRVGYGPLVLDQEPGSLRELEPQEVDALRRAAEGKLRTPKSKDLRRRNLLDAGLLPTVLPKPSGRPAGSFASGAANKLFRPARPAGSFDKSAAKPFRPARPSGEVRPFSANPAWKKPEHPARSTGEGFRPAAGRNFDRSPARPASRPAWKKDDHSARPPARFAAGSTGESRPAAGRPFTAKPAWKKPERPVTARSGPARPASRPAWKKDDHSARSDYKRPSAPRREAPAREARVFDEDLGPVRPPNLHIEEITGQDRPSTTRPSVPRLSSSRPSAPRPYSERPRPSRPRFERPAFSARPFTTSSGKPRAGGARPSSKPGKPFKSGAGRSYGPPSGPRSGSGPRTGSNSHPSYGIKRPYGTKSGVPTDRSSSVGWKSGVPTDRSSSVGWKPKTRYGPGKPASGSRSKPKPGGFSKSGYKGKPGGKKRG
jgi:23S rRNA pseudouridine2605 synthase